MKPFWIYVLHSHLSPVSGTLSRPRAMPLPPSHCFKPIKLRDVWEAGKYCGSAERDDRAAVSTYAMVAKGLLWGYVQEKKLVRFGAVS